MKIVFNTDNIPLLNAFIKTKENDTQVINGKAESVLFETIENDNVDAYVISANSIYAQKAIDYIKKTSPYIPVVFLTDSSEIKIPKQVDVVMNGNSLEFDVLSNMIMHNINMYKKNFETLNKLTAKMHDKIEFDNCVYDPTRRILYHNGEEVERLSIKKGGVLEILAINFGEVVKKEVILEKVWKKIDYFNSRSQDVYVTNLRKTFRSNNINLTIKNVSGIGLILE